MKKIVFIIITSFILFTLLCITAEAIDLIIEEGKVRLSILPGNAKSGTIKIKNTSSEPTAVRAYLEDWYYLPAQDGSKDFKPAGTLPNSCASWITFSPAEFTIPAFGKQEVNYTVRVPKDVTGGHYAVLFFESILSKAAPEEGVGLGVAVRMGSLFYIEPQGSIKREASLGTPVLVRESRSAPLTLSLDFQNTGNVDITTTGNFHIIDKTGMVYARGKFNEVYTFAKDKAKLNVEWKEPIPAGKYDLVITLDLGKALFEAGMGRGPIMVKEAEIEIGRLGEVLSVSALK